MPNHCFPMRTELAMMADKVKTVNFCKPGQNLSKEQARTNLLKKSKHFADICLNVMIYDRLGF